MQCAYTVAVCVRAVCVYTIEVCVHAVCAHIIAVCMHAVCAYTAVSVRAQPMKSYDLIT